MAKKTKAEMLKIWSNHKGCEYFLEDLDFSLNQNLLELSKFDVLSNTESGDKDRVYFTKVQSNIRTLEWIKEKIKSYARDDYQVIEHPFIQSQRK